MQQPTPKIFEKLFDIAGVKAMAINKACAC